jgi:hypothetical protein
MNDDLTPESIIAALEQLERSERGHAAAVGLRKLLSANGHYLLGLDSENWHALAVLVRACGRGMAPAIIDALPKR